MNQVSPLRWPSVVVLIGAAMLSVLLLVPEDEPAQGGGIVVTAPNPAPGAALTTVVVEPEPVLISVRLQGLASTARLRLADGSTHSIGLNQKLRSGWTLVAVDAASATFATPVGSKQLPFEGAVARERGASMSDRDAPTVLIPETEARSADGEAIERCQDPEC